MPYDPEDDEDELQATLMGTSRPAPVPQGAQPQAIALPSAPNPDDDLKPPVYNQPTIPTAPDAHLDRYRELETQMATPAPSHSDPSLKPSIGRRIGGGIAAALMGFGHVPGAAQVGSDVVNSKFNKAEDDYQQKQASTKTQLDALRDQGSAEGRSYEQALQGVNAGTSSYNAQERAYQGQVFSRDRQAQEQQRLQSIAPGTEQPDDPKNPLGSWHATSVGGKPIAMSQPPDSWLKTPQGKTAAETVRRQQLVTDNKLTGDDAKYVMVNGKLKEPSATNNFRIPSAESEKYNDWKSTFKQQNGRAPNAEEIASFGKSSGAGGDSAADAIVQQHLQAKQAFADKFTRQDDGSYVDENGKPLSGKEFGDQIEKFRTDANVRLQKKGYQIDAQGQVQPLAGSPSQPKPNAASQAQPQQAQLPKGNGQRLTDKAIATQFFTAAGGDKAKARQMAANSGWKL